MYLTRIEMPNDLYNIASYSNSHSDNDDNLTAFDWYNSVYGTKFTRDALSSYWKCNQIEAIKDYMRFLVPIPDEDRLEDA